MTKRDALRYVAYRMVKSATRTALFDPDGSERLRTMAVICAKRAETPGYDTQEDRSV